jgi:hypothetical protein
MPRGGRLTIETGNVDMTNSSHCGDAALALGRYAMLAVSEAGIRDLFALQRQALGI